jgi:predicted HTH transcriptional regulator
MQTVDDLLAIFDALKTTPSERLESEYLEFKEFTDEKALHNSSDFTDEICAFANKHGGTIVVGVRDSSNIKNSLWPDQLQGFEVSDIAALQERISGRLRPSLSLEIFNLLFESKNYLIVQVPRRKDSLVATSRGRVCVRDGKQSRPMSPEEIERSVKALQTYDWSDELLEVSSQVALDVQSVEEAKRDFEQKRGIHKPDVNSFLEAIGATRNGALTKAGLLFLGRDDYITDHLSAYEYRFTWRTAGGRLKVNDVWRSSLWKTIAKAKAHFESCNKYVDFESNGKKYSTPAMDPIAFHEAFLNALVHRDYAKDGMVSVSYNGHRLAISSPGGFYGGVTAENIARHEPRHRNKALARMLMLYQLVDRAGMGVIRMGVNSLKYGRGFPQFMEREGSVEVSMEVEFLRAGIFVITEAHTDDLGISDLLVLNAVYEIGYCPVAKLLKQVSKVHNDPWKAIQTAVETFTALEFCGKKEGIYVRVEANWGPVLMIAKQFRTPATSDKHVKLYEYLMRHTEASNADLTGVLDYTYASQTSKFLREAKYVRRKGSGSSARWSLVQ